MRRKRVVILGSMLVLGALLNPQPAAACTISRIDLPEEALRLAEGAFVGMLVSTSDYESDHGASDTRYTFLVEWALKGGVSRRTDVISSMNTGSCGLGAIDTGKRVGLVVRGSVNGWRAMTGDTYDADELLAAAPKGTAVRLGSLGLVERLRLRLQTFPAKAAALVILAFALIFVITLRAERRGFRTPADFERPAP